MAGVIALFCLSKCLSTYLHQDRVVRKPVNANPGLKVNRGNNFSCMKVLSIAYVLCSLRLPVLKTEVQKYKQNSLLSGFEQPSPGPRCSKAD